MYLPFVLLLPLITLYYSPQVAIASSSPSVLTQGSSLFVEKNDHLVSLNGVFTAGFHETGQNAYCFAIWFSEPMLDGNHTLVWMANRDKPVNGKQSKFSLLKRGNLVLKDAGQRIWKSDTQSNSPLQLKLLDSGNLVLTQLDENSSLWQSFSFPTDTILPTQVFTKDTVLISSRSSTNFSSGFYKLYFDNDNVLRLLYSSNEITSVYWTKPYILTWEAGRSTYNNTRFALLDSKGRFQSTDDFTFTTTDYGDALQRRLTLDVDGNIRVYSLINKRSWRVSWQGISTPCTIHGICGPNSLCTYSFEKGRRCTCLPGYKSKNHSDLSFGCEPTFDLSGHHENFGFIKLPHVEFYGFDSTYSQRSTLRECKNACLNNSNCKAIQFTFDKESGFFQCYVKTLLFNGYFRGTIFNTYLKLPRNGVLMSYNHSISNESRLYCSSSIIQMKRTYEKATANGSLKFMLWFSIILGVIEVMSFVFFYYITKQPSGKTTQTYLAIATGFKRFTYAEIVKASHKFKEEIGRGGGGIVYKGILPDNRVVAIKRLHEAIQGEAEFLAEMSTIGRINHKNLIETYGYCAEGKHRILVYEYMENGSLARNLSGNQLDWKNMFEIAFGVAKGLAYLHEECLEWVLHCDVKPQNILLDANYNPKVADFGLSKLFDQGVTENSIFSRIRGTRGYMAPEWVFNLPITSKVDVYSYGMVVLEMIAGRSPTYDQLPDDNERLEQKRLVSWVREKVHRASESLEETQIMEILNPMIRGEYEKGQLNNLLKVALQCVEEDKDARPTMSEVVKALLYIP
ncbi:putative receptor protein kinase ZmPK1 [Bidens hawaiensis]|uniref:putative receptor protein kinase ZmPK1 n=1 Tax=Bidens hawaiensis TaxID=980011 RepID=UPI00404A632E